MQADDHKLISRAENFAKFAQLSQDASVGFVAGFKACRKDLNSRMRALHEEMRHWKREVEITSNFLGFERKRNILATEQKQHMDAIKLEC